MSRITFLLQLYSPVIAKTDIVLFKTKKDGDGSEMQHFRKSLNSAISVNCNIIIERL